MTIFQVWLWHQGQSGFGRPDRFARLWILELRDQDECFWWDYSFYTLQLQLHDRGEAKSSSHHVWLLKNWKDFLVWAFDHGSNLHQILFKDWETRVFNLKSRDSDVHWDYAWRFHSVYLFEEKRRMTRAFKITRSSRLWTIWKYQEKTDQDRSWTDWTSRRAEGKGVLMEVYWAVQVINSLHLI